MNLFENIRKSIKTQDAARHYGMEVQRNTMVSCPFHDDHTPSMRLYDDHYYCFGCGATGDVINLTAKLLDLPAYAATKKLAADFNIPDTTTQDRTKAQQFRWKERLCLSVLEDYLDLLRTWYFRYAPRSETESVDDRFVETSRMIEAIDWDIALLRTGSQEEKEKMVDDNHITNRFGKQVNGFWGIEAVDTKAF